MQIDDDVFFERIANQLDKISDDVNTMKTTLAVQAKDIETHIKRTDLLEMALAEAKLELVPAKNFTTFIKVGLQLVGGAALILGVVAAVLKIL